MLGLLCLLLLFPMDMEQQVSPGCAIASTLLWRRQEAGRHNVYTVVCSCGATTHKTKECLERPRKVLAKHSNADLAHDDVIEDVQFDSWAHKRDAYKGYSADDYAEVVERYEKVNDARQALLRTEVAKEKCARCLTWRRLWHTKATAHASPTGASVRAQRAYHLCWPWPGHCLPKGPRSGYGC